MLRSSAMRGDARPQCLGAAAFPPSQGRPPAPLDWQGVPALPPTRRSGSPSRAAAAAAVRGQNP
eukprot:1806203-Alexandrium_andersonii.AAC.1